MSKTKNVKGAMDKVGIQGFYRVQLTEDNKLVGDSGWCKNMVTNLGVQDYLVTWLGAGAGGKFVSHMALGTGGAPASNATELSGENFHNSAGTASNSRAAVSSAIVASRTAEFTAAFHSSNAFVTASTNISNVGLFNTRLTSLGSVGVLFAGNTYASSSCATNQNVNVTYQIRFGTV